MVLNIRKTSKDKCFNEVLSILIRKYERNASHSANQATTTIGWIVALFIAYLGWNFSQIRQISSALLAGTWDVRIVVGSVLFTTMYISFKVTTWIMRMPLIEKHIFKIFNISNLQSIERTLNLLYLARMEPEGWSVKMNIDDEKGILDVTEIKKISTKE